MSQSPSFARRRFLQGMGALSVCGTGAPLALSLAGMGEAAAQSSSGSDYKALVCIFLYGGNDSFNTVLTTDATSWGNYVATRNQAPSSIALLQAGTAPDTAATPGSPAWLGGVRPIYPGNQPVGSAFALHPLLTNAQSLFNTHKKLAVVSNMGPLEEPLTKAEYLQKSKRVPKKLFSHNDQQNTWLAMQPEGAVNGWGGKLADLFAADNSQSLFTAISASGNSVWLSGSTTRQYQISRKGVQKFGVRPADYATGQVFGSTAVAEALRHIASNERAAINRHVFAKDLAANNQRALAAEGVIETHLPSDTLAPFGPSSRLQYQSINGGLVESDLAKQLQMVARLISMGQSLSLRRQVFFVSLSGFDSHDNQNAKHSELMAVLDHALGYFQSTIDSLGLANKVTTFTASEFGRTFTSNGDGTDHGWGAHHFVMGGAVQGGKIFGQVPQLGRMNANDPMFDSSPDQLRNGVLLPTTSVDQFAGVLGNWFGVSQTNLNTIFPNLSRFGSGTNLSFV